MSNNEFPLNGNISLYGVYGKQYLSHAAVSVNASCDCPSVMEVDISELLVPTGDVLIKVNVVDGTLEAVSPSTSETAEYELMMDDGDCVISANLKDMLYMLSFSSVDFEIMRSISESNKK